MTDEEVDIRDYLGILLRRKWLIIILVAVAALTSFVQSSYRPKIYETSTTVKISTAEDSPYKTAAVSIEYINSGRLLQGTYSKKALDSISNDLKVTATQIANTDQLQIKVVDKDPDQARNIANDLANQFVESSADKSSSLVEIDKKILKKIQDEISYVKERITEISDYITEIETKISNGEPVEDFALLLYTERLNSYEEQLGSLESKKVELEKSYLEQTMQLQIDKAKAARVIAKAILPTNPQNTGLKQNVLLASVLAFMIGIGLAFILEYLEEGKKPKAG